MSRAAKQSYLGRVIAPARYHDGHNNSKPYLSFAIFVDRLAVKAEDKKERTSGKIFCSYSIQSEQDPVAKILCNILDSKSGAGSLNGHTYKSVEIWIEGNEKLTEVKAFDSKGQELSGSYYKSLEYCTVQILDRSLVKLLRDGDSGESHEGGTTSQAQASVAPSSKPSTSKASASSASDRRVYAVGEEITNDGKTYKFLGGDQSSMSNWSLVQPAAPKPSGVGNPFKQKEAASGGSAIRSMLDEDESSDGPAFGSNNRPPV